VGGGAWEAKTKQKGKKSANGGALVAHARAYLGDGNKHWCCWWQHEDAAFA